MGGNRTIASTFALAGPATGPYSAKMTEADRPDDWVIYATLGAFAFLMMCYAIWAIQSGTFYMRPGWRVSRREEPGFFWFAVITSLLIFPVAVGVAAWELNR
jgi:hypothetical protein